MPDRINISGRWYVAEDAIAAQPQAASEPWLPLRRICEEYDVDPHRAYDHIRAGRLDARLPSGSSRGYRVRRSEFERWVEEDLLASGRE